MKALRRKIKAIILAHGGLPGFNANEYMTKMRAILMRKLSTQDKSTLNYNGVDIDKLITDISQEIAEEIL